MTDSRKPPTRPDRILVPSGRNLDVEPDVVELGASNRPLPTVEDEPEVGLSQKGSGEGAIIRRETEI